MSRENNNIEGKSPQKLFKYQYNARKLRRVNALLEKARSYLDENQLQQANLCYQQVLATEPENLAALSGLGDIALKSSMMTLALDFYKYAYEISPADIGINEKLASAYVLMERYDDAIFHYLYVLHQDEDNADAHGKLAFLNDHLGNSDIALQHYLVALEKNPEEPLYLEGIMKLDLASVTDKHIRKVEMNLADDTLSLDDRCGYYFLLGKIYDETGRYDQAFANFKVANMCKGAEFDINRFEKSVTTIIDLYSKEFIESHTNRDSKSEQPVFLIGMPCTGAIQLDQLLYKHRDIYNAGELSSISDIAAIISRKEAEDKTSVMSAHDSIDDLLNNYARYYLNQVNTAASDDGFRNPRRIIDSNAQNFLYLGLITMLFPAAKIIYCRRDLLETALACYFEHFIHGNEFSYDQTHIVNYLRQFQRLMSHWERSLPGRFYSVDYADVVNYPRMTAKEISEVLDIDNRSFDFSPLEDRLDSAMLFDRPQRLTSTVYPLDRWKNYKKQAVILKEGLSEVLSESSPEEDDDKKLSEK